MRSEGVRGLRFFIQRTLMLGLLSRHSSSTSSPSVPDTSRRVARKSGASSAQWKIEKAWKGLLHFGEHWIGNWCRVCITTVTFSQSLLYTEAANTSLAAAMYITRFRRGTYMFGSWTKKRRRAEQEIRWSTLASAMKISDGPSEKVSYEDFYQLLTGSVYGQFTIL